MTDTAVNAINTHGKRFALHRK